MTERHVLDDLNVRVLGDGEPTVVLAHGFGSDQRAWARQVEALAPEHRVVLFDHLGSGGHDLAVDDPSVYGDLRHHRDNLLALYEALGLRDTVFVGHSVSAMLGVEASIARPECFRQLILIGGSPRYLDEPGYHGGFTRGDLEALYEAMAEDYLDWAGGFGEAAQGAASEPTLSERFAATLGAMRPDVAQSIARAIFESDFRALLPHVPVPVLIVQAREDIAVPVEVAYDMASRLPEAEVVVLDAEGHLPHLTAPAQVNEILRAALSSAAER